MIYDTFHPTNKEQDNIVEEEDKMDSFIEETEPLLETRVQKDSLLVSDEVKFQLGLFINLAAPSIVVNVCSQLTWFISSSYAGRLLGSSALAGISLVVVVNITGKALVVGILSAYDTLAGQAWGRKNYKEIGYLAQRAVIVCMVLSVLVMLMFFNSRGLLDSFKQPPLAVDLASDFLKYFSLGFPADAATEVIKGFYRCQNITAPFAYIYVIVTFIHLLLVHTLIRSHGFFGLCYAHILNLYLTLGLCLLYGYIFKQHHEGTWPGFRLKKALNPKRIYQFLKLGIPGIFTLSEWWFWELQTLFIGTLGHDALAAHSIGYNIVPLTYHLPYGVGLAAQLRIATLLPQKRFLFAKKVAFGSIIISGLSGLLSALICFCFKQHIIDIFLDSESENEVSVMNLVDDVWNWICIFLFSDSFMTAAMGVFRGYSLHVRLGLITFLFLWVFGIPLELTLGTKTALGLKGFWISLLIIYTLIDIVLLALIARRNRKATT